MILLTVNPLLLLALTPATEINMAEALIESAAAEAPAAIAVQDADTAEDPKWTGSVNFGAILNTGNTESVAVAASVDAVLKREKDRQTVAAYWNFGETQNSTGGGPTTTTITERKVGASYQYDYFVSEETYYLANAGANSDSLALLDLRWLAGVGIGHQFRDEEDYKLDGELGLVYLEENYKEIAGSPSSDSQGISARLAYNFEKRLTETTVLEQQTGIFPSLKNIEDTYARLDTRIKVKISDNLNAQLQWILQWDNTPASGLRSVDNQFIASLGWGF